MLQLNQTSLCARTSNLTALPLVGKYGPEFCTPCRTEVESHRQILSGRRPENAPGARRFRGALSSFPSDTFPLENVLVSAQANQESGGRDHLISPIVSVSPRSPPERTSQSRRLNIAAETAIKSRPKRNKTRPKVDLNSTQSGPKRDLNSTSMIANSQPLSNTQWNASSSAVARFDQTTRATNRLKAAKIEVANGKMRRKPSLTSTLLRAEHRSTKSKNQGVRQDWVYNSAGNLVHSEIRCFSPTELVAWRAGESNSSNFCLGSHTFFADSHTKVL